MAQDKQESRQVAFRAEPELMKRLDRLVEVMRQSPEYEGLDINRSVLIRMLVHRGLASQELRLGLDIDAPTNFDIVTYDYWHRRMREASYEARANRVQFDKWLQLATAAGFKDPEDQWRRAAGYEIPERYPGGSGQDS